MAGKGSAHRIVVLRLALGALIGAASLAYVNVLLFAQGAVRQEFAFNPEWGLGWTVGAPGGVLIAYWDARRTRSGWSMLLASAVVSSCLFVALFLAVYLFTGDRAVFDLPFLVPRFVAFAVIFCFLGMATLRIGKYLPSPSHAPELPNAARPDSPRGLTLIELIVAMGIIAILVGLLLPAVESARDRGRLTVCINNMHQIALALEMYRDDWLSYPASGRLGTLVRDRRLDARLLVCPQDPSGDYARQFYDFDRVLDNVFPNSYLSGIGWYHRCERMGASRGLNGLGLVVCVVHGKQLHEFPSVFHGRMLRATVEGAVLTRTLAEPVLCVRGASTDIIGPRWYELFADPPYPEQVMALSPEIPCTSD